MLNDYRTEDVITVVSSPFFSLDKDSIYTYKNYIDKFGVTYANLFKKDEEYINNDLYEILSRICADMTHYNDIMSVKEWLETITASLDYLIFSRKNDYFLQDFVKENLDLYNSSLQLFKKLDNVTQEMALVFGDYKCDFKMFFEIYKSYFEASKISMPPITSNTLFVADSNTSFLGDVDYVYVLGANEGNFPSIKMDMGLLSDRDISNLPDAKKIEPTIKYINRRTKFNAFELMFVAKNNLTISYVNQAYDGTKMYPSSIVESMLSLLQLKDGAIDISGSAMLDYMAASYLANGQDYVVYNNFNLATLKYNFVSALKKWSSNNFDKHC